VACIRAQLATVRKQRNLVLTDKSGDKLEKFGVLLVPILVKLQEYKFKGASLAAEILLLL